MPANGFGFPLPSDCPSFVRAPFHSGLPRKLTGYSIRWSAVTGAVPPEKTIGCRQGIDKENRFQLARILIAEDYDDLRDMIRDLLTDMEHVVEAHPNGGLVLDSLNTKEFDLIILDWELPKLTGIEICKAFRAWGGTTPILMLTGKKAIVDKEQGFDAGADDYLTKPFHPKELQARIKALLRRSEQKATVATQPTDQIDPGTIFADRYQIVSPLGRGSTGTIYKAMHLFLHRFVAVKILHPQLLNEPDSIARFKREAQAVSSLSHPNVIAIYDFGITTQGLPYLVMDYSDGISLAEQIKQHGPMSPREALPIFVQACDALAHAHSRGVIHRDVKPGNMMLIPNEDGTFALRIVDFGIAKLPQSGAAMQITQNGDVLGSPLYMSPEQCMGAPLDSRTDIFSLGCVMYMALAGVEPFLGDNVLDTMYKRTVENAKSILHVRPEIEMPQALDVIVMKALARDLNQRYQTMEELRAELDELVCVLV